LYLLHLFWLVVPKPTTSGYEKAVLLFIFFDCPKKTNQKKRHPVTCPAVGGIPCASRSCREFKNSSAFWRTQTVQTPFSATSAVLGSVTMGKNKKAFTLNTL